MIRITKKTDCCGCSACVQACPLHCITFEEDHEGFRYPKVEPHTCIDCGLCERVCPVINQAVERKPNKVFAAKHSDDQVREASSSGGIFTLLAEQIIANNGVVFGARFDRNWEVVHDYTETKDGLAAFRGSKYAQSWIGDTYRQAEAFLKQNRKVLFSGTPCQIAGLKLFLRKEYPNLLTVDFVCHGVPSPLVWKLYLKERQTSISLPISTINFRDKSTGWKDFSILLRVKNGATAYSNKFYHDPYMQAFLANLSLRPSCYACPSKAGRSMSDLTIGDFWGIQHFAKEIDDDKGVGVVMVYNPICKQLISPCFKRELSYQQATAKNICIEKSVSVPVNRNFFWHRLRHSGSVIKSSKACITNNLFSRLYRIIFRKLSL